MSLVRGPGRPPRITVLYQYLYPDDVVSARHFGGLCEGLAARGWDVAALPSNRSCRDESRSYPAREQWHGVHIRRVWRPGFSQRSQAGRLLSAGWMLAAWNAKAWRHPRGGADVVLLGTDPAMSIAVAPVLRRLSRRIRVAHWVHDLYPEALIADGLLSPGGWACRGASAVARSGYQACDLVADLGPCMRERLERYASPGRHVTLVPWALSEPAAPLRARPEARRERFGDASMALLYSGSFGRAHASEAILALARRLRGSSTAFCFAVRGNRVEQLRRAVGPEDKNVRFAPFCEESELPGHLAAADVHVASLRDEWSGVVVPSKFVGSLAAGRPVLFAGPRSSSIARWIAEHDVGWVLDDGSQGHVAAVLQRLARDREALAAMQQRCHAVYQQRFSRERTLDRWDQELRALVSTPGQPT